MYANGRVSRKGEQPIMRPLPTGNKTSDTKARHGSIHAPGGIIDCHPIARVYQERGHLRQRGEVTANPPTLLFIVY
jgi:hypothetical protein